MNRLSATLGVRMHILTFSLIGIMASAHSGGVDQTIQTLMSGDRSGLDMLAGLSQTDQAEVLFSCISQANSLKWWQKKNPELHSEILSLSRSNPNIAEALRRRLAEAIDKNGGKRSGMRRIGLFESASIIGTIDVANVVATYLDDDRSFESKNSRGEVDIHILAPQNSLIAAQALGRMGLESSPNLNVDPRLYQAEHIQAWLRWWVSNGKNFRAAKRESSGRFDSNASDERGDVIIENSSSRGDVKWSTSILLLALCVTIPLLFAIFSRRGGRF